MWWLVIIMAVNFSRTWAIETGGYYLSPAFKEIVISQDQKQFSFTIEVGNWSQTDQTFELSVVDFGSLDETGGVAFLTTQSQNSERKYSLASWISLEKNRLEIGPDKKELVKVTIQNRESLSPGGHYGAVLVKIKNDISNQKDQVNLIQTYASLIYVKKEGVVRQEMEMVAADWKNNWWQWPKTVTLRFKNTGNIHLIPRGRVVGVSLSGKEVVVGIINSGSGLLLPDSIRQYPISLRRLHQWIWPGEYLLKIDYRFDGSDKISSVDRKYLYFGYEGLVIVITLMIIWLGFLIKIIGKKGKK